jgi:hypothetical protein
MKTVYLHIGIEKTGTTTIQNFLHLNRGNLTKFGFAYTKSTGIKNNRKLVVAAYDLDTRDEFARIHNIHTEKQLHDYQKSVICDLKQEIESLSQDKIIFSSEHFQSRLKKKSELYRLKQILTELGASQVYIVVYLRNPADLANSFYSTAIKYGSTLAAPPGPRDEYYNHICHHQKTLENFGEVFGQEFLIPRLFEKSQFKNNSLLEDFASVIELPWDPGYTIPTDSNESLSAVGIEILRRFNKIVPFITESGKNPLRRDIVQYFERYYGGGKEGKYIMPRELFIDYDAEFVASNEWVRQKYFPTRDSLFEKKVYPEPSFVQISEAELDTIANMLARIWLDHAQEIQELKQTMKDPLRILKLLARSLKSFLAQRDCH